MDFIKDLVPLLRDLAQLIGPFGTFCFLLTGGGVYVFVKYMLPRLTPTHCPPDEEHIKVHAVIDERLTTMDGKIDTLAEHRTEDSQKLAAIDGKLDAVVEYTKKNGG